MTIHKKTNNGDNGYINITYALDVNCPPKLGLEVFKRIRNGLQALISTDFGIIPKYKDNSSFYNIPIFVEKNNDNYYIKYLCFQMMKMHVQKGEIINFYTYDNQHTKLVYETRVDLLPILT